MRLFTVAFLMILVSCKCPRQIGQNNEDEIFGQEIEVGFPRYSENETLEQRIDNRLAKYVEDYESNCSLYRDDCIVKSDVVFVDNMAKIDGVTVEVPVEQKGTILGNCSYSHNNQAGKVKINKKLWAKLSERSKYQLILHELGHCHLRRHGHVEESYKGYKLSVMSKYHQKWDVLSEEMVDGYIEELFTNNNDSLKEVIDLKFDF